MTLDLPQAVAACFGALNTCIPMEPNRGSSRTRRNSSAVGGGVSARAAQDSAGDRDGASGVPRRTRRAVSSTLRIPFRAAPESQS